MICIVYQRVRDYFQLLLVGSRYYLVYISTDCLYTWDCSGVWYFRCVGKSSSLYVSFRNYHDNYVHSRKLEAD